MINVPKKALQDADEAGESVDPSVGDEVNLGGVVGVIKADNGDSYAMDITSINGMPCDPDNEEAEDAAEDDMEAMRAKLQGAAVKADEL